MIKPPPLKIGDVIGVVAPSDAVEKEDLEKGIEVIKEWGLKAKIGKHVYSKVGDFAAGTPEERIEDFNAMVYDPEVKVIWAAVGGYAATEILPVCCPPAVAHLKANPKFIIGYSDTTIISNAFFSFGLPTIMGPNIAGLYEWDKKSQEFLRKILFGEPVVGIDRSANWDSAVSGVAEGKILASNLEGLILSFGTRFDPLMYSRGNVILCLEELDIDKSTLQRQIDTVLNHKRAARIKGVVIGRLTNIMEVSYPEWGKKVTPEGLITDRVKKFGVPLAFCHDFGHPEWIYGKFTQLKYYMSNKTFLSLPSGVSARLTVNENICKLEYLELACTTSNEPRDLETQKTQGLVAA
jgi:muramoyltetrapeptide carboxypeptidase